MTGYEQEMHLIHLIAWFHMEMVRAQAMRRIKPILALTHITHNMP